MKRRIGIVGTGWVGSSVAISTLHSGVAEELVLHDVRMQIAEGEAMDLVHGSSFYAAATVRTGTMAELASCDAIVVTAGKAGTADQTRLDLLRDNARITRAIGEQLTSAEFSGLIVMVSNPVDVLTRVMADSCPNARVLGTGTMLETARVRQIIARKLSIDPRSVHCQVIGEHGDTSVVLWSGARIGGRSLRAWDGWTADDESEIRESVRTAAYEIIRRKGATNHAIGLVTAHLLGSVFRDARRVLTVTAPQRGTLGIAGTALSLPAVIGREGLLATVEPELDDAERDALEQSRSVLQEAYESIA